ncbi:hypothetical protein JTE90_006321 [Oedothorax gibbosus]|uniref:Uncharacterized protein n=1 Tax=Oedothorax gibbosus TaxID=931172 RepID=A0AAV6U2J7_9ARAC|nr:hypothetical protein JTE90_006321 [Oedothorax gibbosus]
MHNLSCREDLVRMQMSCLGSCAQPHSALPEVSKWSGSPKVAINVEEVVRQLCTCVEVAVVGLRRLRRL